MDGVTVTEAPKLLSELVAERGYSGDQQFRDVLLTASVENTIFLKKKLRETEAAPATDGTVGFPVSPSQIMELPVLQLNSFWAFTLAGEGSHTLYIADRSVN